MYLNGGQFINKPVYDFLRHRIPVHSKFSFFHRSPRNREFFAGGEEAVGM